MQDLTAAVIPVLCIGLFTWFILHKTILVEVFLHWEIMKNQQGELVFKLLKQGCLCMYIQEF